MSNPPELVGRMPPGGACGAVTQHGAVAARQHGCPVAANRADRAVPDGVDATEQSVQATRSDAALDA